MTTPIPAMADPTAAMATSSPPTSATEPSDVIHQVLDTVELLENILLYLDLRTLLLSQRTSKCFKNIIDTSIKIQRALFFQPLIKSTAEELRIVRDSRPPSFDPSIFADDTAFEDYQIPAGIRMTVIANPLFEAFLDIKRFCRHYYLKNSIAFTTKSSNRQPLARLLHSPPTASWRRMYAVQPRALPFRISESHEEGGWIDMSERSGPEGVLMEEFMEIEKQICVLTTSCTSLEGFILHFGTTGRVEAELTGSTKVAVGKYSVTYTSRRMLKSLARSVCGWELLSCDFEGDLEKPPLALGDSHALNTPTGEDDSDDARDETGPCSGGWC